MFNSDGSYKEDIRVYTENIIERDGVSSKSSEREIVCMSEEGNLLALKLYADMIFYKKIYHKHAYRDAFDLYMKSAGMSVFEGIWSCSGRSYPLAFWSLGYYLVNYKRESVLAKCETIDVIEEMSMKDRMRTALELSIACLESENISAAINLVGRILRESSEDEELFNEIKDIVNDKVLKLDLPEMTGRPDSISTMSDAAELAELFFVTAAQDGYVFACNSLAAKEADAIVQMKTKIDSEETSDDGKAELQEKLNESIINYICYLKIAADKYEPYASNRLGLFYMTGEISTSNGKKVFKEYVDTSLAKEYFIRATVYPDENSAWGYFNLMKYFPKMYERDIDLMNEHMDYIKELNPAVYDLALDL